VQWDLIAGKKHFGSENYQTAYKTRAKIKNKANAELSYLQHAETYKDEHVAKEKLTNVGRKNKYKYETNDEFGRNEGKNTSLTSAKVR
jgi:hypothetical protein